MTRKAVALLKRSANEVVPMRVCVAGLAVVDKATGIADPKCVGIPLVLPEARMTLAAVDPIMRRVQGESRERMQCRIESCRRTTKRIMQCLVTLIAAFFHAGVQFHRHVGQKTRAMRRPVALGTASDIRQFGWCLIRSADQFRHGVRTLCLMTVFAADRSMSSDKRKLGCMLELCHAGERLALSMAGPTIEPVGALMDVLMTMLTVVLKSQKSCLAGRQHVDIRVLVAFPATLPAMRSRQAEVQAGVIERRDVFNPGALE